MVEKIVIIGSGPAGWTCALYAGRANLRPLVYEGAISEENRLRGTLPLGQLNSTTEVENFPGFPEGIQGPELMVRMRQQAERFDTRVLTEDILKVDLSRRPFVLEDSTGQTIQAHTVVIATGASANYLGLDSEHRFKNHGVSACAVCDGALARFRNNPIVVVGGGDSAAEEGNYLTRFASAVHLVHRRDSMRASPIMAKRLLDNPKVKPEWNSEVEEVIGDPHKGLTAVRVRDVRTGAKRDIAAVGMFVAIGHTPNTGFLKGQLKTDSKGFVVLSDPFRTTTSVEGVFAAGDVADPVYKQAITAAGMGCKAALDAQRWLEAQHIDQLMRPLAFTRMHRLHGARQFAAVYAAGLRRTAGPLVIHAKANGLSHGCLGLSIGRVVGNAVARNRVKRAVREAWRLMGKLAAPGYDVVVVVRKHELLSGGKYAQHLADALGRLPAVAGS